MLCSYEPEAMTPQHPPKPTGRSSETPAPGAALPMFPKRLATYGRFTGWLVRTFGEKIKVDEPLPAGIALRRWRGEFYFTEE